jgi:hypothetical protein
VLTNTSCLYLLVKVARIAVGHKRPLEDVEDIEFQPAKTAPNNINSTYHLIFMHCHHLRTILGRDDNLARQRNATHNAYPNTIDAIDTIYRAVLGGRPADRYGHPPALYHTALAALQSRLESFDRNQCQPMNDKNREMFELARSFYKDATEYAKNEDMRWNAVKKLFLHIFGHEHNRDARLSTDLTALKPDVIWGEPPYGIVELKTDSGVSGNPTLQAVRAYIHTCDLAKVCFV